MPTSLIDRRAPLGTNFLTTRGELPPLLAETDWKIVESSARGGDLPPTDRWP